MADYIECRNCESPDCKGCNIKNLETMLNNGKFDCLMNENRCINQFADAAPVRHGRWESVKNPQWPAYSHDKCSLCGWWNTKNALCYDGSKKPGHALNYCPNCGAKMDLEQFGKAELFQESKGENENERF